MLHAINENYGISRTGHRIGVILPIGKGWDHIFYMSFRLTVYINHTKVLKGNLLQI